MVVRVRLSAVLAVFVLLAFTVAVMSAAVNREPTAAGLDPASLREETREPTDASDAPTMTETEPSDDLPTRKTVADGAGEEEETPTGESPDAAEETAQETDDYEPRLSAPDSENACYYSDENIFYAAGYGMPNCTCYAWGRAYELRGEKPSLSPYDACTWYDYNRENGVYDYGDTPEEGAIACWAYADGGSGHVAVVEEVGDESLTFSNSAYSGTEFYTETAPIADPSNGRENWIFLGYIYV